MGKKRDYLKVSGAIQSRREGKGVGDKGEGTLSMIFKQNKSQLKD